MRRARGGLSGSLLVAALILGGCSEDEPEVCQVGTAVGCEEGMICEQVAGAEPACFAPVHITGRVLEAGSLKGIADATIVALDPNGGARSTVVRSGPDGAYALPIALTRSGPDGKFPAEQVTLRVAALGYQPFPTAPRTALPIALEQAAPQGDPKKPWLIKSAATDVALIPLPGGAAGLGTISGRIDASGLNVGPGGVLLVADQNAKAISSAVSDTAGAFILFNVPAGAVTVTGYRSGLSVAPSQVNAPAKDVVLKATTAGMAAVTGSVSFVNAGAQKTSVLLVVESTFNDKAARGETPSGLRVGDVTNTFTFPSVPPGKYVVLAAFENDALVRDPDVSIGGTQIVHIDVKGAPVTAGAFKITGALAVISPGANALEVIPAGDPVMKWADDSSEDGYELRVYNAFGDVVHENTAVPRVSGGSEVSYTWAGAKLEKGMIYQFRVLSYHEAKAGGNRTYISATEDLRGVFQAP